MIHDEKPYTKYKIIFWNIEAVRLRNNTGKSNRQWTLKNILIPVSITELISLSHWATKLNRWDYCCFFGHMLNSVQFHHHQTSDGIEWNRLKLCLNKRFYCSAKKFHTDFCGIFKELCCKHFWFTFNYSQKTLLPMCQVTDYYGVGCPFKLYSIVIVYWLFMIVVYYLPFHTLLNLSWEMFYDKLLTVDKSWKSRRIDFLIESRHVLFLELHTTLLLDRLPIYRSWYLLQCSQTPALDYYVMQ